ncbi:MAG: RidA family protein [Pirellulaceae bacterium]
MNSVNRLWLPLAGVMGLLIAGLLVEQGQSVSAPVSTTASAGQDFDARLNELGITLPEVSRPLAVYKRVVVVGDMAYASGHICISDAGEIMTGKVGADITTEQAQAAARRCAIGMLASLKDELGSLNRIERLVKTTGMVNCTPDFTDQSLVVNGFSNLLRDLMGDDAGVGARAAVGMSSLPRGAIVEVEAIFKLVE